MVSRFFHEVLVLRLPCILKLYFNVLAYFFAEIPQNYTAFVDAEDGYSYYYPSDWRVSRVVIFWLEQLFVTLERIYQVYFLGLRFQRARFGVQGPVPAITKC